jgi:hypothetical protein
VLHAWSSVQYERRPVSCVGGESSSSSSSHAGHAAASISHVVGSPRTAKSCSDLDIALV